jgi:hypothetical protein
MPRDNNILGDLSKIASSAFATLVNIKNEVMSYASGHLKASLKNLDCASKSELNALKKTVHHLQDDVAAIKPKAANHSPEKPEDMKKSATPKAQVKKAKKSESSNAKVAAAKSTKKSKSA